MSEPLLTAMFLCLFNISAVGCPDLKAPSGGWVRRDGDSLTVGCGETKHHLVCRGSQWIGTYENCTDGV